MIYRNEKINKSNKYTSFRLIYVFLFIISLSFSGYYIIHTKHNIDNLKTKKIPSLKNRIIKIKNSIAVEHKNNSILKRDLVKLKAKDLGMVKSKYSNIIDVWWIEENSLNE